MLQEFLLHPVAAVSREAALGLPVGEATLEALEMYAYAVILITQALGSGNLNPGLFPSPCDFTIRQVIQSVASQRW